MKNVYDCETVEHVEELYEHAACHEEQYNITSFMTQTIAEVK